MAQKPSVRVMSVRKVGDTQSMSIDQYKQMQADKNNQLLSESLRKNKEYQDKTSDYQMGVERFSKEYQNKQSNKLGITSFGSTVRSTVNNLSGKVSQSSVRQNNQMQGIIDSPERKNKKCIISKYEQQTLQIDPNNFTKCLDLFQQGLLVDFLQKLSLIFSKNTHLKIRIHEIYEKTKKIRNEYQELNNQINNQTYDQSFGQDSRINFFSDIQNMIFKIADKLFQKLDIDSRKERIPKRQYFKTIFDKIEGIQVKASNLQSLIYSLQSQIDISKTKQINYERQLLNLMAENRQKQQKFTEQQKQLGGKVQTMRQQKCQLNEEIKRLRQSLDQFNQIKDQINGLKSQKQVSILKLNEFQKKYFQTNQSNFKLQQQIENLKEQNSQLAQYLQQANQELQSKDQNLSRMSQSALLPGKQAKQLQKKIKKDHPATNPKKTANKTKQAETQKAKKTKAQTITTKAKDETHRTNKPQKKTQKSQTKSDHSSVTKEQHSQSLWKIEKLQAKIGNLTEEMRSNLIKGFLESSDILQFDEANKKYNIFSMITKHKQMHPIQFKLIYKFNSICLTNFHPYIDQRANFLLIIHLSNDTIIGGFSQDPLRKNKPSKSGFIFSISPKQEFSMYNLKPQASCMSYEQHYLVFGNSQIRIQINELQVYSNFGISKGHFDSKEDNIAHFLHGQTKKKKSQNKQNSEADRKTSIRGYECYEVLFKK